MYKGKFDQKNKQTSVDVSELVAQRNSAPAKQTAAEKTAPVKTQAPAKKAAAQDTPVKKQSAVKDAPAKKAAVQEAPAKKQSAAQKAPAKKQKRGPRLGGVIFYTMYFMFILVFFVATFFGLQWLQGWLLDYEAAQPTAKSQEVFNALFTDPDWGSLYDSAGASGTEFEGKEAYVSYMEDTVGSSPLTYVETSAGLSGDKKYIVKLGDKKVATFTLKDASELITDIPDWQLGAVEVFCEYEESYLIQHLNGHTVYVNGIALDDSYTIQKAATKADTTEGFLPAGASSATIHTKQITGLMTMPSVTIYGANGQEVDVSYDEATKTFVEQTQETAISDSEKDIALDAIKVYAEYQINEASRAELAKYYDASGEAYSHITGTDLTWTKGNNGYSFANESVSGYARYSDTLFSVYATAEMTINLTDGGTQVKSINATLLFENKNGSWKVIRMTNADVSTPVGQVRLTFMQDDIVLTSDFYATDASSIITPLLQVPEGKSFGGWYVIDENEDGSITYNVIFTPDETGKVAIPDGTSLEPMTLYAYFENASSAADTTAETEGA